MLAIGNNNRMKLAVIITCHNRKAKTLACLQRLFDLLPEAEVYLTDDDCTDGTSDEVHSRFPQVHVIPGNGHLYWSRGMYKAWSEALKKDYDDYLWLNDDVTLYDGFWDELQWCRNWVGTDCIVSGLIENPEHTQVIYGGYTPDKQVLQPAATPQEMFSMNGNVVLVPRAVVQKIGIIDSYYVHDLGDVDYSLTARAHGIKVVSTRKAIGESEPNNPCRVRLWNASILQRFKKLNTPLGSPLDKNFHFRRKHYGIVHACAFCSYVILINLMPDWLVVKLWGATYVDAEQ